MEYYKWIYVTCHRLSKEVKVAVSINRMLGGEQINFINGVHCMCFESGLCNVSDVSFAILNNGRQPVDDVVYENCEVHGRRL